MELVGVKVYVLIHASLRLLLAAAHLYHERFLVGGRLQCLRWAGVSYHELGSFRLLASCVIGGGEDACGLDSLCLELYGRLRELVSCRGQDTLALGL